MDYIDYDDRLKMILNMEEYGGSFIKALAECFKYADHTNFEKLKIAFPDYVEKYYKLNKNVQHDC